MTNSNTSVSLVIDILRIQGWELFLVGWFCGKSSVDGNLIGRPTRGAAGLITSFSGYTGDNSGTRWLPGDLAAYKDGTAFTSYKRGRGLEKKT